MNLETRFQLWILKIYTRDNDAMHLNWTYSTFLNLDPFGTLTMRSEHLTFYSAELARVTLFFKQSNPGSGRR